MWFKVSLLCRLRLVFGWLVSVFAGYLDTHEVLLLWDRIVGFNTLTILPGKTGCMSHDNDIIVCCLLSYTHTHTHTHTHTYTQTHTVLAVAVLEFRATNLFKATSLSEAEVKLFRSTISWYLVNTRSHKNSE